MSEKAAALHSLARHRAFVDGQQDKRRALAASIGCCGKNGSALSLSHDEAHRLVIKRRRRRARRRPAAAAALEHGTALRLRSPLSASARRRHEA
jgi:hypothetical protein